MYAKAFDGIVIAEHCEDGPLAEGGQMHEGYHSYSLGLAGQPREAEEIVVARDLAVARLTGGRLHLCHLSSAGSIEIVRRAKAEGLRVTAEVTPHHLVFSDEDLGTYDTNFKVNPPLRTAADVAALRQALAEGAIDCVATDHAPHSSIEKDVEFEYAASGTIGLETALPLCLGLVEEGVIDLNRLVSVLAANPARVLGLPGGSLRVGAAADVTVIDPKAELVVERATLRSRSANSAFLGRRLKGRAVATIVAGRIVHSLLEGLAKGSEL
jgi:dihydroorotase